MTSSKRSPALQNRIFQVREAGSLSQAHQDHPVDKIISLWTTENIRSLLYGKMVIQPVKKGALQWANYVYIELCLYIRKYNHQFMCSIISYSTENMEQKHRIHPSWWNCWSKINILKKRKWPQDEWWWMHVYMNAIFSVFLLVRIVESQFRLLINKKSNHPRFINVWVVAAELLASALGLCKLIKTHERFEQGGWPKEALALPYSKEDLG